MSRTPRQYSRAFPTAAKARDRRTFFIDAVPPSLHDAVHRKAKRTGVSVRALVLSFLEHWADDRSNELPSALEQNLEAALASVRHARQS